VRDSWFLWFKSVRDTTVVLNVVFTVTQRRPGEVTVEDCSAACPCKFRNSVVFLQ
jgi:hypothetical protein